MYVHSIPNNNDNQDIVSMGSNSALMAERVIDNSFTVLSIQLMTVLQAVDYLKCTDRLSSVTLGVYQRIRAIFPSFIEDAPKYTDLRTIRDYLRNCEQIIPVRQKG
jgi:histidine ammonia-lyase